MKTPLLLAACTALALLAASPSFADEGHDHGPAAPASVALPRFAAVSESFELVGVLSGKQLTLYLDRADDNSPVRGAQIELDIAGAKYQAQPHGEAEYEVVLPAAPQPGVVAIAATVTAGNEADLLAGELDLHEAAPAAAAQAPAWKRYGPWAAGAVAGLAVLAWAVRRMAAPRSQRLGGAA